MPHMHYSYSKNRIKNRTRSFGTKIESHAYNWIDDSDSYESEKILHPMEKNPRTRASRLDRPAKTHFHKYSIGEKVIYHLPFANGGYEIRFGTIAEFSDKNSRKYIIRDDKTYVTYLIHETGIFKKPIKVQEPVEEITEPIELIPADSSITVVSPEEVVKLQKLKNNEDLISIDSTTSSMIDDHIPVDKIRNDNTGHPLQQDLDSIENRVMKLENDNKKSKLQRLRNFYTKLGLISSLF